MPLIAVQPLNEAHFKALHGVLDFVARERKYLTLAEAPSLEKTVLFYQQLMRVGCSHVALLDRDVVGWCDVSSNTSESIKHIGHLGMGLLPQARGLGLGRQILTCTLSAAWRQGLTRIELTVRADNITARTLYERLGFQIEGLKRNVLFIDGIYHNAYSMGLLKNESIGTEPCATSSFTPSDYV